MALCIQLVIAGVGDNGGSSSRGTSPKLDVRCHVSQISLILNVCLKLVGVRVSWLVNANNLYLHLFLVFLAHIELI